MFSTYILTYCIYLFIIIIIVCLPVNGPFYSFLNKWNNNNNMLSLFYSFQYSIKVCWLLKLSSTTRKGTGSIISLLYNGRGRPPTRSSSHWPHPPPTWHTTVTEVRQSLNGFTCYCRMGIVLVMWLPIKI